MKYKVIALGLCLGVGLCAGDLVAQGGGGGKQKQIEQLFNMLDADGNGKIAREELTAGKDSVPERAQKLVNGFMQHFDEGDQDGDGEIDKDEFRDGARRLMRGGQ